MRADEIESLFPEGVVVECGDPERIEGELHPLERGLVGRAIEKRAREIVAGRALARRAFERLGIRDAPLLRGEDRAPIWPAGIVGSLSHTRGLCAVVAARAGELRGLGIDLEGGRELPERLLSLVCTPGELEEIGSLASGERARRGRLVFSAKESVYKCQYPLARRWLGFRDVALEIDPSAERFRARLEIDGEPLWPAGARFSGRYRFEGDLVVTAAALSSS